MNSKFYLGLKKVRFSYTDYPNASTELFEFYNELIEEINKHQLNTNEALTKYVVQAYNQITEEQKRISKWCESMGEKDIKALSKIELKELDINENYFKEILSISDDARALCIEYLATYCPEMFEAVEKQKMLKEMLPFSIVAKSVLINHDNSTNIKFIETYNKEVTPERIEKLKSELAEIASIEDKILFLKNKKIEYLQYASPELLDVSGSTSYPNFIKGEPLFFDRIIQLEIDKLEQALTPKQSGTKGANLTYRQQALIIVYNGGQIYRSDTGLYKHRELQIASNRIAEPQNTKAYNDFVNDLKIAIQNLTDAAKNRAIDELKLYENKFKDTFVKTK